jgi:hypothetical protein
MFGKLVMEPEKAITGFIAAANTTIATIPCPSHSFEVLRHSFLCGFVFMTRFSMYMANVLLIKQIYSGKCVSVWTNFQVDL